MPAKAGIQVGVVIPPRWIPAFAGMTSVGLDRPFLQGPRQENANDRSDPVAVQVLTLQREGPLGARLQARSSRAPLGAAGSACAADDVDDATEGRAGIGDG